MALREFRNSDGRSWRVWDITPEKLHPSTRAEDYLQGYLEGWLVFEAADGHGKARLYPIPMRWAEMDDEGLQELLARADQVREGERRSGPIGIVSEAGTAAPDPEPPRVTTPAQDVRTFKYPGGRFWTVGERPAQTSGPTGRPVERVVLRFASGARALDLMAWPRDWTRYSDRELADLLWSGFPRKPGSAVARASEFRRRRGEGGEAST
jgi:hypothetical protein